MSVYLSFSLKDALVGHPASSILYRRTSDSESSANSEVLPSPKEERSTLCNQTKLLRYDVTRCRQASPSPYPEIYSFEFLKPAHHLMCPDEMPISFVNVCHIRLAFKGEPLRWMGETGKFLRTFEEQPADFGWKIGLN